MSVRSHPLCLLLCFCVLLSACAAPAKRQNVLDLYELPHVPAAAAARPTAVDNDSYYSPPAVYQGCMMINDAPSCGGG